MSNRTIFHTDSNSVVRVNVKQSPSFIQARNKLVAPAKNIVNKNNGIVKNNILGSLSQNNYINQSQSKGRGKKSLYKFNNSSLISNKYLNNNSQPVNTQSVNTERTTIKNFDLFRKSSSNNTQQKNLPSKTYRIYVLCYNKERLNLAQSIYGKYSWAVPILMKYQNYTFENSFWKQLLEIKSEWINYKFVGTISYKAYEKINIDDIDNNIKNGTYRNKNYVHFADGITPVLESPLTEKHPNFTRIWIDLITKLNLNDTTESLFNYFICKPSIMETFIYWYLNVCLPVILTHPLILTDANYKEGLSNNELIKLWGRPYYPHIPFILERLNKCFFIDIINQIQNIPFYTSKIAFFFLIPDNKTICGGIRTLLMYIKYLNNMDYNVDFYFGNCLDKNVAKYNIHELINNIKNYGVIDINKNNFYLGLQAKRDYDVIVANAWHISNDVYCQKYRAKKIAYIIQDREELFYPDDIKLKNMVKNTYKPEYNYYCLSKYLGNYFKNMFPSSNITDSVLGFDKDNYFIKNMSDKRNNSVVIAYYKGKPGRLPILVETIIQILSKKYKCYIYPDIYNKTSNANIINCGKLSVSQLNDFYNNNKVGIVFSNTNPSRLGFEMVASGLNVIEYYSEFTKYDLNSEYFTLIQNEQNIMSIVDTLMKKNIDLNKYNTYKISNNNEKEKEIVCDFFKKLL